MAPSFVRYGSFVSFGPRGLTQGQERGRPNGMGTKATRRIRAVVPSVLDPWQVLLLVRVPARGAPADLAVVLAHWYRMRRIIGNRTTIPAREAARLVSMKGSHSLAMTGPIRKSQIPCGSRKEQAGTRTCSSEDPTRHSPSRPNRSRPVQTCQRRNG